MRQRAALIRTLVLKPDIMLWMNPFLPWIIRTRLNVSDDIGQIIKKRKTAILVTLTLPKRSVLLTGSLF